MYIVSKRDDMIIRNDLIYIGEREREKISNLPVGV